MNSFPAAAAAPNGDLYATWTTEVENTSPVYTGDEKYAYWIAGTSTVEDNCHSVAVYSKSTDGGATWTDPQPVFAAATRTAQGYPAHNPDHTKLTAPNPSGPVEDVYPAVDVSPSGHVYIRAYRGDYVSPWQTCASAPPPPQGRIECDQFGNYINNTRLDYVVRDLSTATTNTVSTHPINTQYGFGGGFIGDYTDLAVGSDGVFHALWTETNNQQTVTWFYGLLFAPTPIHQEDIATYAGSYKRALHQGEKGRRRAALLVYEGWPGEGGSESDSKSVPTISLPAYCVSCDASSFRPS